MTDELRKRLLAIQEGAGDDIAADEVPAGDDEFDDLSDDLTGDDLLGDADLMSEVTLSIIESEIGADKLQAFITENAQMLVRDKLLTESSIGKSYMVLSPDARRKKAIDIMKLRMARDAGDSRYKKIVVARKLLTSLLGKIRVDPKYKKAESIVKRMKFKIIQNPQAVAAMKRADAVKLEK